MIRSLFRICVVIAALTILAWSFAGCSDEECPTCPKDEAPASLSINILHPQPDPARYNAVFAVAPNDAFIAAAAGVVLRWHNGGWTKYDTPVVSDLRAIWASSPNDVFVSGDRGVVVHYDGSDWGAMDTGILHGLYGLWGTSANNVYAVGLNNAAVRYTGARWEKVDVQPGSEKNYLSISGFGATDIYVAGVMYAPAYTAVMLHYNGTNWAEMQFGTSFNTVWCSPPDTVYAGDADGWMWRLNPGGTWQQQQKMADAVYSIWGSDWNDLWAMGSQWDDINWVNYGTVHRYNGTVWNPLQIPFDYPMKSVNGISSSEVYAVGDGSQTSHWDGNSWEPMNDTWVTGQGLDAIWGFDTGELYAFGNRGTMVHYDGSTWTDIPPVTNEGLVDVWAAHPDTIYAVGWNSKIVFYDGINWVDFVHPFPIGYLQCVWGTSTSDVRAGGDGGQMLYFDGVNLQVETIGEAATGSIRGLWGSAPNDYYAVTYDGVLHYDGNTWTPIPLNGRRVNAVHGVSATEVYFVGGMDGRTDSPDQRRSSKVAEPEGGSGYLLRYNGSTYTELASNLDIDPWDVWAIGSKNVFMSGSSYGQFAIAHYNGSGVAVGTNSAAYRAGKLWCTGKTAYTVGPSGIVARVTAP
jgi:hypothetical protein